MSLKLPVLAASLEAHSCLLACYHRDLNSSVYMRMERRNADAALQQVEAEASALCQLLLWQAPSLAVLAAAATIPAWPGVASGVFARQLPAALWPALLAAASAPVAAESAPDALASFLEVHQQLYSCQQLHLS